MKSTIIYLTMHETKKDSSAGVSKKIFSQINAMRNNGFQVYLASVENNYFVIRDMEKDIIVKKRRIIFHKNIDKLNLFKLVLDFIKNFSVELIYIRLFFSSYFTINFFKIIKNNNIKLFLEIPTYPYDKEAKGSLVKILNFFDRIYRNQYKDLVDKIITYSSDKKIFGVPCINISNGIDVSEIGAHYNKPSNEINLISVSAICYWHGLDRIIHSVANYYKTNQSIVVKLIIVGPLNSEAKKLQDLVNSLGVADHISFVGSLSGENLNNVYNNCHIGIGSLGRHRSGIYQLSSLKNREYCAKGLPMIYSENDIDFDNMDFTYKVSADENFFDLLDIINWYQKSNFKFFEIVEYAQNFTWDKKILEVLKNLEN